jgi:hypothetical protein
VSMDQTSRENLVAKGKLNAARFETEIALDAYERIYERAVELNKTQKLRNEKAEYGDPESTTLAG